MRSITVHLFAFILGACVIAALAQREENSSTIKAAMKSGVQSTTSKAPATAIPEAGLQVQRFMNSFSGTWSITQGYEPSERMPNGGEGHGKEVWRPGPGGLSMIEEIESTGVAGQVAGMAVGWWDEKEQGFRMLWCVSTNPRGCILMTNAAKWEGNQFVVRDEPETMGKKTSFKEVFSDITRTSFTQTVYRGELGGELKPFLTIRANKATTAAKP